MRYGVFTFFTAEGIGPAELASPSRSAGLVRCLPRSTRISLSIRRRHIQWVARFRRSTTALWIRSYH